MLLRNTGINMYHVCVMENERIPAKQFCRRRPEKLKSLYRAKVYCYFVQAM